MNKKLIYFTNSYPFGIGEQWKATELSVLVEYFEKIIVVPYSYGGNRNSPKLLPKNIEFIGPLFDDDIIQVSVKNILCLLLSSRAIKYISEIFRKKLYLIREN